MKKKTMFCFIVSDTPERTVNKPKIAEKGRPGTENFV